MPNTKRITVHINIQMLSFHILYVMMCVLLTIFVILQISAEILTIKY